MSTRPDGLPSAGGRRRLAHLRLTAIWGIVLVTAVGCRFEDRSPEVEERPEGVEAAEEEVMEDPGEVHPPADRVRGEETAGPAVLEGGEPFWVGADTEGAELVGRFLSREALEATLDPDHPIGRHEDREWTFRDILVTVDYRGPDDMATWRVAGPGAVIRTYVSGLEERAGDRSPFRELGILPLEVRFCCPPLQEGGIPPQEQ